MRISDISFRSFYGNLGCRRIFGSIRRTRIRCRVCATLGDVRHFAPDDKHVELRSFGATIEVISGIAITAPAPNRN